MIKQQGLGLIEVMFAIVVSTLILLYGINAWREQQRKHAVEQSASDIRRLLQLAVLYHSREELWPQSFEFLKLRGHAKNIDFCSSWFGDGKASEDGEINPQCPQHSVYFQAPFAQGFSYENARYYGVSLNAPTPEIAQRIATLLPSAIVTQSTKVTAYVSALIKPHVDKGWIMSAGIVRDGGKIFMPKCPAGFEGHMMESPYYFTGDKSGGFKNFHYTAQDNPIVRYDKERRPYIFTKHIIERGSKTFHSEAFFLTLCIVDGSWKYQVASSPQTGQCNADWQGYNAGAFAKKC